MDNGKRERWPVRPKLVEVFWSDHCGQTGWGRPESYDSELSSCRSVGYVLRETKNTLTLIQSMDASGGKVIDSINIGKRLISRRRRLR